MTRRGLLVFLAAAAAVPALAQSDPLAAGWRGDFRFVHLAYSGSGKVDASTQGGLLSFDGAGVARLGEATGTYSARSPHQATLTIPGAVLELHRNPATGLIAGSAEEPGLRHHLLVAVRAAEGLNPAILRGPYGAAYLAVRNNEAAGLVTAFAQFAADGAGKLASLVLSGHAASIDDVVRREGERPDAAFELTADGTGLARFGTGSDAINGDLRIAASPDGAVVLGWSADAAQPALMIAVRKNPDSAVFSFRGRFWIAEAAAENSFVFQQSTRWSSAAGSMASGANGYAFFSQRVSANAETTQVTTSNQYRVSTDGRHALVPKLDAATAGIDNFAFNDQAFVAAQVGVPGQLSLNHGLAVGIAQPPGLMVLANAAAPSLTETPLSPGALLFLSGPGFAVSSAEAAPGGVEWPTELGGARVRINGVDAQLASVAPEGIRFQCPAQLDGSGPATVEVVIKGEAAHTLRVARAASSPAVLTPDGNGFGAAQALHADGSPVTAIKPAEAGESITLMAVGLGGAAAGTLRVLFGGEPAEVTAAGPAAAQPGRYQVKVTIPRDLDVGTGGQREVPVALVTPDSFTDLADVLVVRR